MIPSQFQPLANHLWQSTLFAAVAGLLTLALRKNRAATRYWLWLAASAKFLIPFSLLVSLGSHFRQNTALAVAPLNLSSLIQQASRPFATTAPLATGPVRAETLFDWIPAFLYAMWATGFLTLVSCWCWQWRSLRAAVRTASPLALPIDVHVVTSPAFAEPQP